ncbi:hypothetical protein H072_8581 [Dactylellina haptotyla CBS 200.50]|uniref:Autophagy-related protein 27 n=1 Tax=Dactylellina haptotyla (strain CBS 200.50) TaxID=1284197 RepID=S8A3Z6_DACHA|nr:hypothetical protein H072_8581 [Dactylellina haptotyla CBS 200.50]
MRSFNTPLTISALFLTPTVLAGCGRFVTNEDWTVKLNGWDGYRFLGDNPIQISDYVDCTRGQNSTRDPSCTDTQCAVVGQGGVLLSAKFNIPPINNNETALGEFFSVVRNDVKGVTDSDKTLPMYRVCGNLTHEYEKTNRPVPSYCIDEGDTAWIRYDPQYFCVNGTAEDCTNGPYESGTELVVCAARNLTEGTFDLFSDRTVGNGSDRYTAELQNPSLNHNLTCQASIGTVVYKPQGWSLALVVLLLGLSI